MRICNAVLFMTHLYTKEIYKEAQSIECAVRGWADFYVMHDISRQQTGSYWSHFNNFDFSLSDIKTHKLSMLRDNLVPGSVHLPVLLFHIKTLKVYQYVWLIENDVRFTGAWETFFSYFHNVDDSLLACHLRPYHIEKEWPWWGIRNGSIEVPLSEQVRGFFPIYRISSDALEIIIDIHRKGYLGHQEVIIPTFISKKGLTMRDFGGAGPYVKKGDKNRFYIDAKKLDNPSLWDFPTVRWRPAYKRKGIRKNKLYHPVK